MGTTTRIMEDHTVNTKTIHSIKAMEIDLELDLSIIRMGTGETMENFVVLHRPRGETSHEKICTANQEVINLTILPSPDLTIDLRLVLHLTNNIFHKNNNQAPSNMVRFIKIDVTINADLCPLN